VVGKGGSGAQFTSVQAAVDTAPADASPTAPALILILPGVYAEQVIVEKSGLTLQALGRVELAAPASGPTVIVRAAVASAPRWLRLAGLAVTNAFNGQACVALTGGAGSRVGQDGVYLDGCQLVATGVGGYALTATAVNRVYLNGCATEGGAGTASLRVQQCKGLTVTGGSLPAVQADYDSGGAVPFLTGSAYEFTGCTLGPVQATLTGAGSVTFTDSTCGDITLNGDRTLTGKRLTCGTLAINNTGAVTLTDSQRGAVAGTGTLNENRATGSLGFSSSTSEDVVFSCARADDQYGVYLDAGVAGGPWVTGRGAAGFTINFALPVTTTVRWLLGT